jgi:hypothetical protein
MAVTFKPCAVPGCNGNAHHSKKGARELCSAHYQRLRKHGDPTGGGTAHGEPRKWLEAHADHSGEECLKWPFTRRIDGYAVLSDKANGRGIMAHRFMCTLAHGDAPTDRHQAAHNCGNGHLGCVNPRHLRWDTAKGNMADKVIHGRNNRGTRNPKNVLTEDQVRSIRRGFGIESVSAMARRAGVSRTSVRYIIERRNWAWLPD